MQTAGRRDRSDEGRESGCRRLGFCGGNQAGELVEREGVPGGPWKQGDHLTAMVPRGRENEIGVADELFGELPRRMLH
jgi:hypothetical protein